jgi:hypothetical protein
VRDAGIIHPDDVIGAASVGVAMFRVVQPDRDDVAPDVGDPRGAAGESPRGIDRVGLPGHVTLFRQEKGHVQVGPVRADVIGPKQSHPRGMARGIGKP